MTLLWWRRMGLWLIWEKGKTFGNRGRMQCYLTQARIPSFLGEFSLYECGIGGVLKNGDILLRFSMFWRWSQQTHVRSLWRSVSLRAHKFTRKEGLVTRITKKSNFAFSFNKRAPTGANLRNLKKSISHRFCLRKCFITRVPTSSLLVNDNNILLYFCTSA